MRAIPEDDPFLAGEAFEPHARPRAWILSAEMPDPAPRPGIQSRRQSAPRR